jgi:hypothetical protein
MRNTAIFYVAGFFGGSPKSRRQSVGAVVGWIKIRIQDPDPQHCNILYGRILQWFAKEPASVGWCCCWIRDSGWIKIRIRDKHPGSATLEYILLAGFFSGSPKNQRQSVGAVVGSGIRDG